MIVCHVVICAVSVCWHVSLFSRHRSVISRGRPRAAGVTLRGLQSASGPAAAGPCVSASDGERVCAVETVCCVPQTSETWRVCCAA